MANKLIIPNDSGDDIELLFDVMSAPAPFGTRVFSTTRTGVDGFSHFNVGSGGERHTIMTMRYFKTFNEAVNNFYNVYQLARGSICQFEWEHVGTDPLLVGDGQRMEGNVAHVGLARPRSLRKTLVQTGGVWTKEPGETETLATNGGVVEAVWSVIALKEILT